MHYFHIFLLLFEVKVFDKKIRSFTEVKKLTMNIIVLSSNFWIFTEHCKHFEQFSGHHLWVSNNQGTCGQIDGWIVYSTKCISWRLNRLVPCTSLSLNEHLRLRVSAIIGLTCVKFSEVFSDGRHSIIARMKCQWIKCLSRHTHYRGRIQINVLITLTLKLQVLYEKIENLNHAFGKDIIFIFFKHL